MSDGGVVAKDDRETLGKYIISLRKKKKLSLNQLAEISDVHYKVLRRLESGEVLKINPFFLKKLSNILEVDYKKLFVIVGFIDKQDYNEESQTIDTDPITRDLPLYKISNQGNVVMKKSIGYKKVLAGECSKHSFAIHFSNNLCSSIGDIGDIGIIDPAKITDIFSTNNEVYLIRYQGKYYLRKVTFPNNEIVILKNLNDNYKDFCLTREDISDLSLEGKLVKIIRETKF